MGTFLARKVGKVRTRQLEKRDDQIKISPNYYSKEDIFHFLTPFVTAISSKNSESGAARKLKDIKCRKQPAVGENVLLAATREEEHLVFQTVERISNVFCCVVSGWDDSVHITHMRLPHIVQSHCSLLCPVG
ncbi:uncharacterized protein LOC120780726 [Bactrocera tryoni]|uniref:uncharacterized protein LOC120780726 n=1 Tax=Bactrocera tryoni TaxID=59916 RepID=UPI001A973BBC|nr:uncharacterized protein LOC120780726 [Bactrocera tryoni]